jgi:hypothetical protein
MRVVTLNCPACGGEYGGRISSRFITCEYCGTRFGLGKDELEALGFVDVDGDGFDDSHPLPSLAAEDVSDDPMDVFANNACTQFLRKHAGDRDCFKPSRKILAGLGIDGEAVYLIHDDTMFKSGKNGFAVTASGVYCREMGDKQAHFVSWGDLALGTEPQKDEDGHSYVRQDGISLCYFSDNDRCFVGLYTLFVRLWVHAKKMLG